ncbi:hypothetical protein DPMN_004130 [Dreissena polymorpha]|uniref:Uncharacterized protein n=1 Tax=Dreissena polymorpha TaxID=45954 RepID=A0A9D4MMY4_DREPO|nr:hypothetical protein DPMN_004130 [Dreissena polymorpha]
MSQHFYLPEYLLMRLAKVSTNFDSQLLCVPDRYEIYVWCCAVWGSQDIRRNHRLSVIVTINQAHLRRERRLKQGSLIDRRVYQSLRLLTASCG